MFITNFSIIMPMDADRLEQFAVTKRAYDAMPQTKEFVIPTRSEFQVARYLDDNKLMKDVRILPYTVEKGFNCSKALNLGVRNAKYENIIITSPEVKPLTDVLGQLAECIGTNVICEVMDEDEDHKVTMSLVNNSFRNDSPAYYFLAMFNRSDIEKINGWDEEFMKGYAYEDNDFGARWNRAGLPFIIRDDIRGLHQYHPRNETIPGGMNINFTKFNENNDKGVVWCEHGMDKSPLL